jgi:CRP-like cAMP-binding protein
MTFQPTPCNSDKLAEKLESTRWAIDLNWNQLVKISVRMKAYSASAGDILFEEGSKDGTMGIVLKGRLSIMKLDDLGVKTEIATLSNNQSFGEMSLLDDEPRSASIEAATDVEVLLLTRDALFGLVDANPSLAFKLLWSISKLLSQKLRQTSGRYLHEMHH